MKIKKAVIPVAGLGTRFLPATKAQPKEMLPIVDKPAVQYIVEEAVQAGIERLIGDRYDIGDKLGYMKASIEMGLKRDELHPELLMYLNDLLKRQTMEEIRV